jgi:hypothetical protein
MMLKGIPDEITRLLEHERGSFSCITRISKTVKLGHYKCNVRKKREEGEKEEKNQKSGKKFQNIFQKKKEKLYPQIPS